MRSIFTDRLHLSRRCKIYFKHSAMLPLGLGTRRILHLNDGPKGIADGVPNEQLRGLRDNYPHGHIRPRFEHALPFGHFGEPSAILHAFLEYFRDFTNRSEAESAFLFAYGINV